MGGVLRAIAAALATLIVLAAPAAAQVQPYGTGYVGAEDRLFVMDVLRHAGRAQLSSFAGGAEGNREMDREQWEIAPYTEADLQRQYEMGDDVYGEGGRE